MTKPAVLDTVTGYPSLPFGEALTKEQVAGLAETVAMIGPDADLGGGWWGNGTVANLIATIQSLAQELWDESMGEDA